MGRRLLVTGGSGYLGRAVVAQAQAARWSVTVTSHTQPGTRLDVRDAAAVRDLVSSVRPDAVVHTAYRQDGPDARTVIVDGTEAVARAAARARARLVHVSTDVVFDGTAGRPYCEDDPPAPLSPYGAAKAEAEARVAAAHADTVVVRTSLLYGGPGCRPGRHEVVARDPGATFYVDELRCPAQVDDLARALVELAGRDLTGILHVAGPDAVSRQQFAALAAGRPVRGGPAPPGRPLDCRLDTTRARTVLRAPLRGVRAVFAASSCAG